MLEIEKNIRRENYHILVNGTLYHPDVDPRVPNDANTCMQSPYTDSLPLNYFYIEWNLIDLAESFT
jgi:hypothetical protein